MGDIEMLKGGLLAWLLRREGGGSSVTGASASSRGLPKRRGGRNSKYIASKCITGQQAELDVF